MSEKIISKPPNKNWDANYRKVFPKKPAKPYVVGTLKPR